MQSLYLSIITGITQTGHIAISIYDVNNFGNDISYNTSLKSSNKCTNIQKVEVLFSKYIVIVGLNNRKEEAAAAEE